MGYHQPSFARLTQPEIHPTKTGGIMSWKTDLKGDPLPWLLEPENPAIRYLALRDLLDNPAGDDELEQARLAAHTSGPIAAVLAEMRPAGYWVKSGPGYTPCYRSTDWAVIALAQMGACVDRDERLMRA